MTIEVDLENGTVQGKRTNGETFTYSLDTPEAFAAISHAWLRCGWDTKYVYSFTWLGRPIIQLPEDLIRLQEVIYATRPDVIIETGVAHGGGLAFYTSIMQVYGGRQAIGIDIEIRPHNRTAIEAHPLASMIHLIEGSSTANEVVEQARSQIRPEDTVMVILDSNHSYEHVLNELRAYAPLVTPGSWIVACDGIMQDLVGAPRSAPDWDTNNPVRAVETFLNEDASFELMEPEFMFNEGLIQERVTYWPKAFLRRVR
ncbi:MAG: hydroxylase [Candidatus Dadabacteria bacterium]|nr:MAG: hydroxylase [Candidatus Dadabacteria bacterium]